MSKLWLLLFALTPLFKGDVKQQIIFPNDYETIEENTFIANSPIIPQTKTFGMIVDNVIENVAIQEIEVAEEIKNQDYIECLIKCESNWNDRAWSKDDPNGGSFGILQFQKKTWDFYSQLIGIENPDIWNAHQQVLVADYMISKGQAYQWTCSKTCGIK